MLINTETFLEFERDSRMQVRRINPVCDNFPSVSSKGKDVVDYIVALFECLDFFSLLVSQVVGIAYWWMKLSVGYKMPQSQEVFDTAKKSFVY